MNDERETTRPAAHTPGPWRYHRTNWMNKPQERYWYVSGDFHSDEEGGSAIGVCIVEGNATSHPVCEANARLIAAAPTMYAALCEIATAIEGRMLLPTCEIHEVLDEAIAKAKGNQP